jgi:hypothetical protein
LATALDICKRALYLIGATALGETPTSDEVNDALIVLNTMLDSWSTERLSIYVITQDVLTLTPGQASYTIGPSTLTPDLTVTARPLSVQDDSFIRLNGADYPLTILAPAQYRAIVDKSQPTSPLPLFMFYDTTYPLGTLYFWPVPTAGTVLYLYSQQQLAQFATLTTPLVMPPGYQRALEYSLAEELSPAYGFEPPRTLVRTAASARRNIKRQNLPDLRMSLPDAVVNNAGMGYADFRVL